MLTTLPYAPSGSSTAIYAAVGFNLFYDTGGSPAPEILTLGLPTTTTNPAPTIESSGIAVDSQNNFILAVTSSSLYGSGAGIVHINAALNAFLADPVTSPETTPLGIACQTVGGTNELAFTEPSSETYAVADELPLFSGQITPAQLREAYGVNQISFTAADGQTVAGDGSGQTIAIVEEGVDPTLEADLTTFDNYFGIAAPPSFQTVDQNGVTTPDLDIVGEASLDVEWRTRSLPARRSSCTTRPMIPATRRFRLTTCSQPCSRHRSCQGCRS